MKKSLIALILAFTIISIDAIEAYSSVTITFRLARKRDCKGFGWCRMDIVVEDDGAAKPIGNSGYAVADINEDGNLTVSFDKKTGISPEAFATYFSKGIFLCEDDFQLPAEILKALHLNSSYTIKAGEYPIHSKGDLLTIVF